uniref:G-protein coupled receptors family 1 profile domain-containing protein n=1 Tax=Rhinolophus ferrumequinum TaxID=59479 RepID=A0A671F1J4_RHIFE
MNNISVVTEFILLGFSGSWMLQFFQSGVFIVMYLSAMMGNVLIIARTSLDPCLHTPMHFFLRNLSLFDLCLISAVVPKTVVNSLTYSNSFFGCVTRLLLVPLSAVSKLFLLTAMSIDHYAAICHPLHYEAIMNGDICVQMAALSWVTGGLISVIQTFSLSYCGLNEIQRFFCDIPQLLAIICSENITLFIFIEGGLVVVVSFTCILVSYILIGYAIVRMPSPTGKGKAFSTCSSHICVVLLFFGTIIGVYLCPSSSQVAERNKAAAVMYTVITPLLNPFIYSIRNSHLRTVFRKTIQNKLFL